MSSKISQPAIGVGQVWEDLTSFRAVDVNYINSTGRPVEVQVTLDAVVSYEQSSVYVDGLLISMCRKGDNSGHIYMTLAAIVPAGSVVKVAASSAAVYLWRELR